MTLDTAGPGTWHLWRHSLPLDVATDLLFTTLYGGRSGASGEEAVWLDSALRAYGMGRFSIMGAPEGPRDHVVAFRAADGRISVDGREVGHGLDVWEFLAARLDRNPVEPSAALPFAGGYIGYAGYGVKTIGAPRAGDEVDACFAHLSRFLVVDHDASLVHVVAVGPEGEERGARDWIAHTVARVEGIRAETDPADEGHPPPAGPAEATVSRAEYLDALAEIRRRLLAGDSYEACYTYALRFDTAESPLRTYRRLRTANPAPYASYLRLGGREVLSCSPERYLRVSAAGWAETKPIKGTARRVRDEAADREAARALAADPKTRAENLMIVDLLRNDLGRICAPGTVTVPELMAVESYATVHQLVTSVRGRLRPRRAAAVGAASALFPPGSMTGAPKRRTVELLDGLEAAPRGVYSGVIGHFSRCGSADLAVVIRTAVVRDGRVEIGTGGAITVESDPAAEADETVAKSAALLAAFGRTHPFGAGERARARGGADQAG